MPRMEKKHHRNRRIAVEVLPMGAVMERVMLVAAYFVRGSIGRPASHVRRWPQPGGWLAAHIRSPGNWLACFTQAAN